MSSMPSENRRRLLFVGIVVICLLVALIYVLLSARRGPDGSGVAVVPVPTIGVAAIESPLQVAMDSPLLTPAAQERSLLPNEPFLMSLNLRDGADIGKVWLSTLAEPDEVALMSDLHCERVYFAAQTGICLQRIVENVSAYTVATIFDSQLQPRFQFNTDGLPSRARVAPDGRYAAFTVFIFGHSYADDQFATATFILDSATGSPLANLEEFTVFQDGKQISFPDFNYWGVTFAQDSNTFYATLRFNKTPYLVKGDIAQRTITVLHANIECPSLSPDETRVAFKKFVSRANWHLAVLDLTTFAETELVVTENVDDQAEWLDNQTVLYGAVNASPPPSMNVMRVRADGTGTPEQFVMGASSPAVVHVVTE